MRAWPLVLVLALAATGCRTRMCRDQTVLVSVRLEGGSDQADLFEVEVTSVGGSRVIATVAHTPGVAAGQLEIDFPRGYPVGQPLSVKIAAGRNEVTLGIGSASVAALPAGCVTLTVEVRPAAEDLGADLHDASAVDGPCTPGAFAGFDGDGGVLDCTGCGCSVDELNGPEVSLSRWSQTRIGAWSDTFPATGGWLLTNAAPFSTDTVQLDGNAHFYLDGDFDLLLDYEVLSWPAGGAIGLGTEGVLTDGGRPSPYLQMLVLNNGDGGVAAYSLTETSIGQTPAPLAGTLQLTRAGKLGCARLIGGPPSCYTAGSVIPLFARLSASCNTGCDGALFRVRFANLRLKFGRLVSTR